MKKTKPIKTSESSMNPFEQIKSAICHLTIDELARLSEELQLQLAASLANQQVVFVENQPIDVPISSKKDPQTGELKMRYTFYAGLHGMVAMRETAVTAAAQKALISLFSESLAADDLAGRTPPKPATRQ